jgi:hypothetical protein
VSAAVELAASLKRIAAAHGRSDPVGCGVTTGRAFCGNIGAASRTEWSVVGDVVRARNDQQRVLHRCRAAR